MIGHVFQESRSFDTIETFEVPATMDGPCSAAAPSRCPVKTRNRMPAIEGCLGRFCDPKKTKKPNYMLQAASKGVF